MEGAEVLDQTLNVLCLRLDVFVLSISVEGQGL